MMVGRALLVGVAVSALAVTVASALPPDGPGPRPTGNPRVISHPRFKGWTHWGSGHFDSRRVDGRTIYVTRGGMGLLWFEEDLSDFTVTFGFRVGRAGGNSGIFLRVPDPVGDDHVHRSFEVQIDPDGTGTSATGAIYDLQPPLVLVVPEPGTWYRMRIVVAGERTRVYIDGVLVNDFTARTGGTVKSYELHGYLGLQNHSDADVVRYRSIRLH